MHYLAGRDEAHVFAASGKNAERQSGSDCFREGGEVRGDSVAGLRYRPDLIGVRE